MQVEAAFTDLPSSPLELRMSRSSPGRYSLHEFAKNVYDVEVVGADGRALTVTRPDPYGWTVPQHGAAVTVRYRVFGDRVDGTYLSVDTSHAHVNMPSAHHVGARAGRSSADRDVCPAVQCALAGCHAASSRRERRLNSPRRTFST